MVQFAHQETVGITVVKVADKTTERTSIRFQNMSVVRIFVGADVGITATNSYPFQPNQEKTYSIAMYDEVVLTWFAVADAAGSILAVWETLAPSRSRGVEGVR